MLKVTAITTVNAAFLQEIKDDNVHLRNLLWVAHKAAETTSATDLEPVAFAGLLGKIRDQLATHFTLEETFGYFEDAVDVAPWLSEKSCALREEHKTLYLRISELADAAERVATEMKADRRQTENLIQRFRDFCRTLKRHEADEADLIMDALYDEIGVGD